MRTFKLSSPISLAIAALATLGSAAAQAEYRCAKPGLLTIGEVRACELARQASPAALIHFVNRTKGTYGLYVNDYVSDVDVDRWDVTNRKDEPASPAVAKTDRASKSDRGTD